MMKSNYYEEDNAEGEDNDGDDGECQDDEDNGVNEGDDEECRWA
jgi:hypothetical protein